MRLTHPPFSRALLTTNADGSSPKPARLEMDPSGTAPRPGRGGGGVVVVTLGGPPTAGDGDDLASTATLVGP